MRLGWIVSHHMLQLDITSLVIPPCTGRKKLLGIITQRISMNLTEASEIIDRRDSIRFIPGEIISYIFRL